MVQFYQDLPPAGKHAVARVSEDVPLAVRDLSGIVDPVHKLIGGVSQQAMAFVICGQVFLNLYTAMAPVAKLFFQNGMFAKHRHSMAELSADALTICYNLIGSSSFTESNLEDPTFRGKNECIRFHRPNELFLQRFLAVVECTLIVAVAIPCILNAAAFLCKNQEQREHYLKRKPFVLVMLPKLAGTASLLKGLTFANTSFVMRSVKRGDLHLYRVLLESAWCPRRRQSSPDGEDTGTEDDKSYPSHLADTGMEGGESCFSHMADVGMRPKADHMNNCESCRSHVVDAGLMTLRVGFCAAAVLFALLALRSKFNMLYFVSTVSWHEWGIHSWLLALGFVNQMASMIDLDMYEFIRILLLKFGGTDAQWSKEEVEVVEEYFALVFSRFAEEVPKQPGNHGCPGLRTFCALVTFKSDVLQGLLLSKKRGRAIEAKGVREERHRVIKEVMFADDSYGLPNEDRMELVQGYWHKLHDEVVKEHRECLDFAAGRKESHDKVVDVHKRCSGEVVHVDSAANPPLRAGLRSGAVLLGRVCPDEARGGDQKSPDTRFMELAEKTRLLALLQAHMAELCQKEGTCHSDSEDDDIETDGEVTYVNAETNHPSTLQKVFEALAARLRGGSDDDDDSDRGQDSPKNTRSPV